jgi:hypothetical protein
LLEGGNGFLKILEGEEMEARFGIQATHVVVVGGGYPSFPASLPSLTGGEELEGLFVILSQKLEIRFQIKRCV